MISTNVKKIIKNDLNFRWNYENPDMSTPSRNLNRTPKKQVAVAPRWRRWRRPHRAGRGSRYRKLNGIGKLVDASNALNAAADLPLGGMAPQIDALNWPRRVANCSVKALPPPSYINNAAGLTHTHTHITTEIFVRIEPSLTPISASSIQYPNMVSRRGEFM